MTKVMLLRYEGSLRALSASYLSSDYSPLVHDSQIIETHSVFHKDWDTLVGRCPPSRTCPSPQAGADLPPIAALCVHRGPQAGPSAAVTVPKPRHLLDPWSLRAPVQL